MSRTIKEYYTILTELIGKEMVDFELKKWFQRQIAKARKIGADADPDKPDFGRLVELALADLNERAGTNYRASSKETRGLIRRLLAALPETTLEDIKHVHEIKCHDWLDKPDWAPYLRPRTLYNPGKFEGYLQAYHVRVVRDKSQEKAQENKVACARANLTPWYEFSSFEYLVGYMWEMDEATYWAYECPRELRDMQRKYPALRAQGKAKECEGVFREFKTNKKCDHSGL